MAHYLYGGQLMIVLNHSYRCGSQSMVEPNPKDQHMAKLDTEDQPLNTRTSPGQWVGTFGERSQSNAYHSEMGYCSSTYMQPQPSIIFDMFGYTMYSTSP
ncbi:hypothetical protein GOBAR_AA39067 [Gossypium barbadense]|uniref:Uncharacterized protein n=1 Tax=Gossypium barbadense TaxID=3634 RepID=A0A2P5VS35_GOSBA|nr:hypothetical protein GOBAR_AA39067 [Gossypium barbadense]